MGRMAIVMPEPDAIAAIAGALRQSDKEELWALLPWADCAAMLRAMAESSCWVRVLCRDGKPIAITGVGRNNDGSYAPWLVGTDDIDGCTLSFMRAFRMIARDVWKKRFLPLRNYVDARQAKSVAFIRALGFAVSGAKPYGPRGSLFNEFTMEG